MATISKVGFSMPLTSRWRSLKKHSPFAAKANLP
jgi:hypothetical protein